MKKLMANGHHTARPAGPPRRVNRQAGVRTYLKSPENNKEITALIVAINYLNERRANPDLF